MSLLSKLNIDTSALPDSVKEQLVSAKPDTSIAGRLISVLTDAIAEVQVDGEPAQVFNIDDAIVLANTKLGLDLKRSAASNALRNLAQQGKIVKVEGTKSDYTLA